MSATVLSRADQIRALNDRFRRSFCGGAIVVTAAFEALSIELKAEALQRVRTFDDFNTDNDPHHEHDMAFFEVMGTRFYFKHDYYSLDMRHGSDNPADPGQTRRMLTIGLASDY